MSWYCAYVADRPLHRAYHDLEYGVWTDDEAVLFERLVLEIMQPGLSWDLILRRRAGLRDMFLWYDLDALVRQDDAFWAACLEDTRAIRHRVKIQAVRTNSARVHAMRAEGGFGAWLLRQHPQPLLFWQKVFRQAFAFGGPSVTKEFLLSVGLMEGAHAQECPVHRPVYTSSK